MVILQVKDLIKFSTERLSSWEGIKQLYQEVKYSVVTIVGLPFRVWAMMRELLREGCFIVESDFEYAGEPFYIRTFIQPDADIITVIGIPHLNDYPIKELYVAPENERVLLEHYFAHNLKVVSTFEGFDGRLQFWGYVIDLTAISANIYPLYQAFVEQTQEGVLLAGAVGIATVLLRQFAKKRAIRLIVNLLFKLAGKYFKSL